MGAFVDLKGKVFGRWTVMEVRGKTDRGSYIWFCKCKCGTEREVVSATLRSGTSTSCGCVSRETNTGHIRNRKDPVETAKRCIWRTHAYGATGRGLTPLTIDEYFSIATQNCASCGINPQPRIAAKGQYLCKLKQRDGKLDQDFADSLIFSANGIDRIDSSKGYSLDNVQPMCSQCNLAKSDYSQEEFEDWALRLADNIRTRRAKQLPTDNEK